MTPQGEDYRPPAEWFDRWWNPTDFFAAVHNHNERVPRADFFANPEYQALREAWAAGYFSSILAQQQAVRVKLDADRFPDFALECGA